MFTLTLTEAERALLWRYLNDERPYASWRQRIILHSLADRLVDKADLTATTGGAIL